MSARDPQSLAKIRQLYHPDGKAPFDRWQSHDRPRSHREVLSIAKYYWHAGQFARIYEALEVDCKRHDEACQVAEELEKGNTWVTNAAVLDAIDGARQAALNVAGWSCLRDDLSDEAMKRYEAMCALE